MPYDATSLTDRSDLAQNDTADSGPRLWPIYAGLILALAALAGSVALFGLPGLYIPAVALVPVMFLLLIRITLG